MAGRVHFFSKFFIFTFIKSYFVLAQFSNDPTEWLIQVNNDLAKLNRRSSELGWINLIRIPNARSEENSLEFSEILNRWKNAKCNEVAVSAHKWNLKSDQARMIWLLCRGPKYTPHQAKILNSSLRSLINVYTESRLCRWRNICYSVEPDLVNIMKVSKDPAELLWIWHGWHTISGKLSLDVYPNLIFMQNQAAINNGYSNIGECWREELEIGNVEQLVEQLYWEIAPLHKLLHAYVRYHLMKFYGETNVPQKDPIPAHLLGNLWSQSWENIHNLLSTMHFNFDELLKQRVNSTNELILLSEMFYKSLGFPSLSKKFWQHSQITKIKNGSSCHGTAANMFRKDDYRMLLCAEISWQDLYVIHHEMGHIYYFKAYENLPTIFKDGANSAFQEAIGDTIMLAVETPKHLQRIGILPSLITEDMKISLLLHQALKKIPQIAFGLIMDKWRWNVMASEISPENYNTAWWNFRRTYEGIQPPVPRAKHNFDAASKFHIADNTPYIRYYLAIFLQFQLFDQLCASTYENESYRLNECDLYGSKKAGDKLWKLMSQGSSKPWYEVLNEFTSGHYRHISSKSLLKYFSPLIKWLQKQIQRYQIPIGW